VKTGHTKQQPTIHAPPVKSNNLLLIQKAYNALLPSHITVCGHEIFVVPSLCYCHPFVALFVAVATLFVVVIVVGGGCCWFLWFDVIALILVLYLFAIPAKVIPL